MSAAHDDRGPGEHRPSTDVSEAEAEAIAGETSADQIDDVGLVAPTYRRRLVDGRGRRDDRPAPDGQDDDATEPEEDRRHLQQGSGQASPSFGEQQQRVPPTP